MVLEMNLYIINGCAGTDPKLPTAGTDPDRRDCSLLTGSWPVDEDAAVRSANSLLIISTCDGHQQNCSIALVLQKGQPF